MILDNSFPPDPRVENEAITLINEGHEVFLFCLEFKDKSFYNKKESISGIEACKYSCSKYTYKLSALAYTLPLYHLIMSKKIKHFISTNNIEVVHIHDIQIARSIFWLKEKMNFKTILDLHENRPEIMKFYSHVKSLKGRLLIHPSLWKKFEYKYIRKTDYLIVVTKSAKEYYQKEVGVSEEKIKIVPNTIRKAFYTHFKLSNNIVEKYKNDYVLLYLGETGLRRGTIELIRCIPFLIDHIPNIKLVVVGKSKEDDILKQEIKNLKIEKYVELTGWQPFDFFQSYITSAKIGCSPLHRNIHHDTTFANKIFQYSSLGLPLLVSDCTAQKEIVEELENGLIHKEKDPKGIADSVKKMYDNPKLYNQMSSNSSKGIKEKYNWEETSKELTFLYNEFNV